MERNITASLRVRECPVCGGTGEQSCVCHGTGMVYIFYPLAGLNCDATPVLWSWYASGNCVYDC